MAERKTQKTSTDVDSFLESIDNDGRREDAIAVRTLMETITGEPAVMWGSSIVGFGLQEQTHANGKTSDFMAIGFSPRKANMVLYITDGFESQDALLAKLGPHKTGKSCLYLKRLSTVDHDVLSEMIEQSYLHVRKPE